jgi:photosystem II stability/assembly factor-like uncharacterized protein
MKKVIILLVALVSINVATAQWVTQNSGTTKNLNSVHFTNIETGYVVGDSGTILKTIDGGLTWIQKNSSVYENLKSVYFPDASTGFAVGENGTILKTSDGGDNWTPKTSGTTYRLNSVYFTDIDNGFAVGLNIMGGGGKILKSIDAGENWSIVTDTEYSLFSIHFPDHITGYISGSSGIYKTHNGGNSWITVLEGTTYLHSVFFINADTGWAVGGNWGEGIIYKTTNGGTDWNLQNNVTWWGLHSVFFVDANNGYAVGPEILKSINGGVDWTNQLTPIFLYSAWFQDSNSGFAVGEGGTILKTTNGGTTGINESRTVANSLIIFPNPAKNKITISSSAITGNTQLSIFNVNGEKVLERQLTNNETQIDISVLPRGVYFVRVQNEKMVEVRKMIKQ